MFARTAPLTAAALAVAVVLLLPAGAPAATAGVRVLSPADEGVVPAAPVRVQLAVPDVRGLRVTVDRHDITGQLRAAGGRRTVVLRGARVKPGAHWLAVRWRTPQGRRARMLTRRFMVARRQPALAVKLTPRAAADSTSGVVSLRLTIRRGVGLMRAWANGRRVGVPHLGRLWPATTLRLGARQGIHFGRNRVRVLVHDFRHARYDVEAWTVNVRRTRPLAAGIFTYRGEAGGRAVRLDGRGALATSPGRRLSWRWRIVRRPRGSRAQLVNPTSVTFRLPLDVRGRYTLFERISERARGVRGNARTTAQRVTVVGDTNAPPLGASLQVELPKYPPPFDSGSITIDDAPGAGLPDRYDCADPSHPMSGATRCVYPMPDVDQAAYVLVLDALTLEPKAFSEISGCQTDSQLKNAIEPWGGRNVIAILTSGQSCGGTPSSLVANSHSYTYIFTPSTKPDLGIRSGWYSEAPTDDVPDRADVGRAAEISGFLQKSWPVGSTEASEEYRFVPGNYVPFDTNKAGATAGQNTIVVGAKEYTSQLPGGGDGFQVLVLDKTLKPMLGTPRAFANGAPVGDMARLLEQARTTRGVSTVFVQSIGRPTPSASSADAWNTAAVQLENLGGNTDVFLSLGDGGGSRPASATGWYSLVAAPDPACLPSSRGPCDSETEASAPLTGKNGDLSGVLGRNQTWQYVPLIDQPGGVAGDDMLSLAYQDPQRWKYSDAAARPVLDYLANYKDGATDLRPLGDDACYDPGKLADVRSSYCNINTSWAALHSDLGNSKTGEGVCGHYPGAGVVHVSADQYASICDQIALETEWLAHVKDSMLNLKREALGGQALTAYMSVASLSDEVKRAIESGQAKANRNVTASALELAGETLELGALFLGPEAEAAAFVVDFVASSLVASGEVTDLAEGEEQGDSALNEPVTLNPGELGMEMQNRLSEAGAAFDHEWDMIVSDPAKLQTAYERFVLKGGIWKTVPDNLDNAKPMIQNGVRHWAAGKFMAATYDVWMVDTSKGRSAGPADVHTIGCDLFQVAYVPFVSSEHWETWAPFYRMPQEAAYYLRDRVGLTYADGSPRHGSNIVVLAQGDVSAKPSQTFYGHYKDLPPRYWPPVSLLRDLYAPPTTGKAGGGYGWERPWLYNRGQRFIWHGPGWMSGRCDWFSKDRVPYDGRVQTWRWRSPPSMDERALK